MVALDKSRVFQALRREVENFKKVLVDMQSPTREEEIKKAYSTKLKTLQISTRDSEDRGEVRGGSDAPEISDLLVQIQGNPKKARDFILQFLGKFPLQDHDREVLADTFATLPPVELEKAISDLQKNLG